MGADIRNNNSSAGNNLSLKTESEDFGIYSR